MKQNKIFSNQIKLDGTFIRDYGETLSPAELKQVIKTNFSDTYEENGYIYGDFESLKYCIYLKNICHLGKPHSEDKKRIQIMGNFRDLYQMNIKNNIITLIIGIYSYQKNILFCDYDTSTYSKSSIINSSANLNFDDLKNAKKSGYFTRKDKNNNKITLFDTNNIDKFLLDKFEITNNIDDFKVIESEIKDICNNFEITSIEKDAFIEMIYNVRNPSVQKKFKEKLRVEFGYKCALCEIDEDKLLYASHIIPYSKCKCVKEMGDHNNGLLLCVEHDALFDKYLITFDEKGYIVINKNLDKKLYELLKLNNALKLDMKLLNKDRLNYLENHRKIFNEKE